MRFEYENILIIFLEEMINLEIGLKEKRFRTVEKNEKIVKVFLVRRGEKVLETQIVVKKNQCSLRSKGYKVPGKLS